MKKSGISLLMLEENDTISSKFLELNDVEPEILYPAELWWGEGMPSCIQVPKKVFWYPFQGKILEDVFQQH